MHARLFRVIKKVYHTGLFDVAHIVKTRIDTKLFHKQWYALAIAKQANHSWQDIAATYSLEVSYLDYIKNLKKQFVTFPVDTFHFSYKNNVISSLAEKAQNNVFDILGSGSMQFANIPWHTDFRLQSLSSVADCSFEKDTYYRDIQLSCNDKKELGKDIKVSWDLSRFQHLIFLGQMYKKRSDKKYVIIFTRHITDWIDANPFLLGVNWLCPMEVALRAINWIWAFYYFNTAEIAPEFWEKYTNSLYDHFVYLENNWELYDGRTSNHYLSDLVGYLYLCYFFLQLPGVEKKAFICSQRIVNEMQKQVFFEGTSYEGSTQYHRLVTELLYHASVMMETLNFSVPDWYKEQLEKMLMFIDWCSPKDGLLVSVGDHDSGSVLYEGLSQNIIQKYKKSDTSIVKHYPQFGLSIMKTDGWHITLRHHVYTKKQPSGHFHNDIASITLAYKGVPILVDPASYVYTASAYWRNYFRSVMVHNTFFVENEEPVPLDTHLFGLDLPERIMYQMKSNDNTLYTQHNLYQRFGLQAERVIECDKELHTVKIIDMWLQEKRMYQQKTSVWNFTLASGLDVCKEQSEWKIYNNETVLATITSDDLTFETEQGWTSSAYGKKERCIMLRAYVPIEYNKKYITIITVCNSEDNEKQNCLEAVPY